MTASIPVLSRSNPLFYIPGQLYHDMVQLAGNCSVYQAVFTGVPYDEPPRRWQAEETSANKTGGLVRVVERASAPAEVSEQTRINFHVCSTNRGVMFAYCSAGYCWVLLRSARKMVGAAGIEPATSPV